MASSLHTGLGVAIAGVLAAAVLTVGMVSQPAPAPEPAAAPAAPVAFVPREPARAPTEGPFRAARPAPALRVTGRGQGHGAGLSQWGAFSMARAGHDHHAILRHYYTDVAVGSHPAASSEIRVNLFHGNPTVGDPGRVRLESLGAGVAVALAPGAAHHLLPVGTSWTVAHGGGFVLLDGNGQEIDRGPGPVSVTYPSGGPAALRLPQVARSTAPHEGGLNYGSLEITLGAGVLRPVVAMRVDDYVLGVAEVPSDWPMESQKAQAVAARTYAASRAATGVRPECGCHMGMTVADQVYAAYGHEGGSGGGNWRGAVTSTAGQVLTHDGALIEAVYSAAHAGRSEHAEDSWAFDGKAFPYLRSVADPWVDDPVAVAGYRLAAWAHAVDHATVADLVGLATVVRVEVTQRTAGGAPLELAVTGWDGEGRRVHDVPFRGSGAAGADLYRALRARAAHPPSHQIGEFGFVAFPDVPAESPHAYNVAAIAERGVATGGADGSFAPGATVRRDQLAAFLARALGLAPVEEGHFADVPADSVHRRAINAVAAAGIALGVGDGAFAPSAPVTRDQMATFLSRAFVVEPRDLGHFADTAGSVHRLSIDGVAEGGITTGCDATRFCPREPVTRGQMASFLARAMGYGW